MIGEGWDFSTGYIERSYRTCADDTANAPHHSNATADLCWRLPNAHLVLDGESTELVLGADGRWRLADDDAAKVELLTLGAGVNGDNDGEYWRITTIEGTEYYFGRHRLPNWATGDRVTNATWTVPVFANHTGESCFNTTSFAASYCVQAYQWNLDYVVDRHGNSMAYFYDRERMKVGRAGDATTTSDYDRAGRVIRIEYGTRAGQELATDTPPARSPTTRSAV